MACGALGRTRAVDYPRPRKKLHQELMAKDFFAGLQSKGGAGGDSG